MKLTSYTIYALSSLQLEALNVPDLVRINSVVKIHWLAKLRACNIMHNPRNAEWVITQRGRRVGFQLARPANTIVVVDVVRLIEGQQDVVECLNPKINTCPLIGGCKLSRAIRQVTDAFMAVLDYLTIAVITSKQAQLLSRIALVYPPEQLGHGSPP